MRVVMTNLAIWQSFCRRNCRRSPKIPVFADCHTVCHSQNSSLVLHQSETMQQPISGTWIAERVFTTETSSALTSRFALPTTQKASKRILVGRLEWILLASLRASPWLAKTDTGARTSSLHATHVSLDTDGKTVHFRSIDHDGQPLQCQATLSRIKSIRNSSGQASQRLIISMMTQFPGGLQYPMEFSLSDRSHMKYPIILGRRALAGFFLVDPQSQFLLGAFSPSL
jgi:hypothetical protein